MATRIMLGVNKADGVGSISYDVVEDFDVVMEKIWPVNPATSALENRGKMVFTQVNGKRVAVQTQAAFSVEEEVDLDD